MKHFLLSIFGLAFLFSSINVNAQHTKSIKDIFYLLPDSVFTDIPQLNFAVKDSFPIPERDKMIENFDAKKKSFTAKDPRFHITALNDKNNLIAATNGELNFNVKVWAQTNNETLIAVEGNYKEDMGLSQTIKFYNYKGGKFISVKVLPEPISASLFFETSYLQKQGVEPNTPVPDLFIVFSKTGGEELQVRIQKEIFDEELHGTKATFTKLSYIKISRPDLILNLKDGKFVITK